MQPLIRVSDGRFDSSHFVHVIDTHYVWAACPCSSSLSLFFWLSFAGLSPTFSFSIFQICVHDNLFKLNIACVAGGIVAVLCGCEIKVLPSNLTRLYYNGSAAKSHSTTTQYRQLRRLSLILQTTRIQKQFPLSSLWTLQLSLLHKTRRGWLCDFRPK